MKHFTAALKEGRDLTKNFYILCFIYFFKFVDESFLVRLRFCCLLILKSQKVRLAIERDLVLPNVESQLSIRRGPFSGSAISRFGPFIIHTLNYSEHLDELN